MQNTKISYMQISCVVLLVVSIYCIGAVSGCSTNRNCGFNYTIGNKTIFYRIGVCCLWVSPSRCTSVSKCNLSWWTSKPIINSTTKTNHHSWTTVWTPWMNNISSWNISTYPTITYNYTSYDKKHGSSPNYSYVVMPVLIVGGVISAILCTLLFFACYYCSRCLKRTYRRIFQRFTDSQSLHGFTSQSGQTVIMVESHINRGSTFSQALVEEPPSYEDVVTPSAPRQYDDVEAVTPSASPQYDDVPPPRYEECDLPPPPRYEDCDLPPPPRYEDCDLPPPPRYEDVINEDNAATNQNDTTLRRYHVSLV